MVVVILRVQHSMNDEHLVQLWKRGDGLRCLARKRAPHLGKNLRWALDVVTVTGRLVKTERFASFTGVMRAARLWRDDFAITTRPE
jgi:hypothetical protein